LPTIIGVIFFLCGVYCFFFKEDSLLGLLIIAGIFEAASAINIGERGIQPYYVVAAFLIARSIVDFMLGARSNKFMPQRTWLLLFAAIAIASAFLFPVIFAGIPVYDPKVGIDDGLFIRPPLSFGLNNLGQAAFLACHIATAYAVLSIEFSSSKAQKTYLWAFYLVVFILTAQSFCQLTGIPFPHSLILNNPGYALWDVGGGVSGTRNPGSFSEPSVAGAFLVLYCVGFLAKYLAGKGGTVHLIVSLVASGLVASSASLLTLCVFTVALMFRYFPLRLPWYVNLSRTKRLVWIVLVLAVPAALALIFFPSYRETLMTLTVSKGDSSSFLNRMAADLYALQLLPQTHWMGVGLGGNRASSLLTTLLSNVGVAGFLAFVVFYFRLFAGLPKEYAWLRWAAFALLADMFIGVADVTMPMLWIPILLAIQFSWKRTPIQHQLKLNTPALVAR
jgi:hypothetical protein